MSEIRIPLPWSAPPLSLNDRGHWRARAEKTAMARNTMLVLAAKHRLPRDAEHVTVQLHYRPRDRRRRDTDNLVATLKPICDGLAAGTRKHPGYGMVPDDTPEFMAKPEPIIHEAIKGEPGAMWLTLTFADPEHELADRFAREDHQ